MGNSVVGLQAVASGEVSLPAGPGVVERGAWGVGWGEYFPGGCWVRGFWGLKEWVALSASEGGFAARMGVKRPEMGSKRRFLGRLFGENMPFGGVFRAFEALCQKAYVES